MVHVLHELVVFVVSKASGVLLVVAVIRLALEKGPEPRPPRGRRGHGVLQPVPLGRPCPGAPEAPGSR